MKNTKSWLSFLLLNWLKPDNKSSKSKQMDELLSNAAWHCREFTDEVGVDGDSVVVTLSPCYEKDLTRRLKSKGFVVRRRQKGSQDAVTLSFAQTGGTQA